MTPLDKMRAAVAADLAAADQDFAREPDGLAALEMIQAAAVAGVALPPAVAKWLESRIGEYLAGGADSLDRALGLVAKPGADSPRNLRLERAGWGGPLAQVHILASLGATIPQAAHMVAAVTGKSAALLERKYRDRNWTRERERDGAALRTRYGSQREIDALLAEYPDDLESRLAKDRIRAQSRR